MSVPHGEQRAFDANRQEERGSGGEVSDVDVAAEPRGRDDRVRPRGLGSNADRPGERPAGQLKPVAEEDAPVLDRRNTQPRLGEVVGKEAEARNDRCPAPSSRSHLEHLDLEHVARLALLEQTPGRRQGSSGRSRSRRGRRRRHALRSGRVRHPARGAPRRHRPRPRAPARGHGPRRRGATSTRGARSPAVPRPSSAAEVRALEVVAGEEGVGLVGEGDHAGLEDVAAVGDR